MDIDVVSFAFGSIVTCFISLIFLVFQILGYKYPSFWFGFANRKKRREILKNMYEEEFKENEQAF